MIKNRKRKGFTLIELVIVIAIIGILAAIAIPRFSASTDKARNAKIEANVRTIGSTISTYYADLGNWKKVAEKSADILKEAGVVAADFQIVSPDTTNGLAGDKIKILYKGSEKYTGDKGSDVTSPANGRLFEY